VSQSAERDATNEEQNIEILLQKTREKRNTQDNNKLTCMPFQSAVTPSACRKRRTENDASTCRRVFTHSIGCVTFTAVHMTDDIACVRVCVYDF
jgi:hypothetical protein